MPRCLIIAGPNGAGKTTFALEYLLGEAGITRFLNADMIASGLSPFSPEDKAAQAGRLFLEEIEAAIGARDDFAFETTLSGAATCNSSIVYAAPGGAWTFITSRCRMY